MEVPHLKRLSSSDDSQTRWQRTLVIDISNEGWESLPDGWQDAVAHANLIATMTFTLLMKELQQNLE